MGYRVLKSQFGYGGKVYKQGEVVELPDEEALYYLEENVVVSDVGNKLPTDADNMLAIKEREVEKFREIVKVQTAEIAKLTEELKTKETLIKNLNAKKK